MKSNTLPLWQRIQRAASCLAVGGLLAVAATVQAQTDSFNSPIGALDPNWATSVSAGFPGTISFPADPYGGQAVRLQANLSPLATGDSIKDATISNPRVMAWRTDRLYTNFYVAADILAWDTSIVRDTNTPLIGLMARITNVLVRSTSLPVGRPDGMGLVLQVNRFGGTPQGTRGTLNLVHFVNGGADDLTKSLGLQADCTLTPGHQYRMVFTGTNLNPNGIYWGRVYDLQDLTRPLATVNCPSTDGEGNSNPTWEAPGYSGIASIAAGTNENTDVTFDNFVALEYPPTAVSLPGTTNGEAGLPQVINRTPASYGNFYAPAGGISFTATTLGGGNVTSAKLFLNGVDVSAGLNNPAAGNSRNFNFPGSGLTSNTVYDARIELANAAGQKTTNSWTFDTFSDAFLAWTNVCKVIECEDFDFGASQFIDNPVPSGWSTNFTYANNFGTTGWPWTGATNEDLTGPPYTSYVNKGTPSDLGVDYYDKTGHTGNQPWFSDFRPLAQPTGDCQSPGTSEGCPSYQYVNLGPPYFGQNTAYDYDTLRQKYADMDPLDHSVQEYILDELEGGEWYNYTRTFASGNYYNVYLRNGCMYNMQLRLDQIGAGPTTNKLGEFYIAAALMKCNWRYTPLMTLVTPPNSLIVNGNFAANASLFTFPPGYIGGGGVNPSSITGWTDLYSAGGYGLNGSGTGVGDPFSPNNPGGLTYAFIQGGDTSVGHVLSQNLTGLAPNTTYTLVYSVAGRLGNTASYRVALYSDSTFTTSYYDSGVQAANSSGFVTVTATFTTPATLGSAPNIQLGNWSVAGDNSVDFANVFLVPGSSVVTSQPAVVNFSGPTKLRLTVDVPQEERTKFGLTLNYMALVPALLVESSSQVNTGYTIDNTAVVEPVTPTGPRVTIPQNGAARFYRLRWPGIITSIKMVGGNVVLTYQ